MAFGGADWLGDVAKYEAKESPWAEPHAQQDPRGRVVGWRNGGGITKGEQEKILQEDKEACQSYVDAKKAIAHGRMKEIQEPLAGLPPTWQAFWSTVPDLDAQAAYRAFRREQAKLEKAEQVKAVQKAEEMARMGRAAPVEAEVEGDDDAIQDEISKLETEVREKKQALVQCQRRVEEWDMKLAKARQLDREEEVEAKKMKRTLDSASFKHGVLQGKIRSSHNYFGFLQEDTKSTHYKKKVTLQRSCNLMSAHIGTLKAEMRSLLKVAADKLPSHTADEASHLGTNSALEDDARSNMSRKSVSQSTPGKTLA